MTVWDETTVILIACHSVPDNTLTDFNTGYNIYYYYYYFTRENSLIHFPALYFMIEFFQFSRFYSYFMPFYCSIQDGVNSIRTRIY